MSKCYISVTTQNFSYQHLGYTLAILLFVNDHSSAVVIDHLQGILAMLKIHNRSHFL